MKRFGPLLAAALAAFLAGSCLSAHHATAIDVDTRGWQRAATFLLPNSDTAALHDLHLFLRCGECFAEDTVTFRITVTTPGRLRFEELFPAAIPRRHSSAALLGERIIPYRRAVRFTETGDYRISIAPLRPLKGVEAVGLDIVKSE